MVLPTPSALLYRPAALTPTENIDPPYFQGMHWDELQSSMLLSGLKTVATLQGQQALQPLSQAMIQGIQEHILCSNRPIESLPLIHPQALAQNLIGAKHQQLALQFMILMPYLSMEVQRAEVALVNQFAHALHLCPHTLKSLNQVQTGQMRRLLLAYTGRSIAEIIPGQGWLQKGKSIVRVIHQYLGDPQVAQRYQSLKSMPSGTLGRELFDYYCDRNLPLPGEKGSFSEILVPHDLIHLLSGLDTSPRGEIAVAGFEAGMSRNQFGFELLLEVILDFHLGLNFTTMGILDPSHNQFVPDLVLRAFAQGTQVSQDLFSPTWPFWQLLDQPIATLRQQYHIIDNTAAASVY